MATDLETAIIREASERKLHPMDVSGPYASTFEETFRDTADALPRVIREHQQAGETALPDKDLMSWVGVSANAVSDSGTLRRAFGILSRVVAAHIDDATPSPDSSVAACKRDLEAFHPELKDAVAKAGLGKTS